MNMPPVMDTSAAPSNNIRTHPEGKSLVLAVLLQDTVLDLHYDSVFDACPICSCNGSIKAKVDVCFLIYLAHYLTKSKNKNFSVERKKSTL